MQFSTDVDMRHVSY